MKVVVLSGGVGGARLVEGLAACPIELTVVVNTGDDFDHWGLRICPDLDTVMYTLSGLADRQRGWGLAGETFRGLEAMRRLGGSSWFSLGDQDLATHILRTQRLRAGTSLTEITRQLCEALGVGPRVLPMTDTLRPTRIDSDEGILSFQDWLVGRRGAPTVRRVLLDGAPPPAPGVLGAIEDADVVVIPPSNPYVSVDPILTLPGVRGAVARRRVVAVSPIVGGRAVKGPLAGMIPSLAGVPASAAAVAAHYGTLLDGMVVETGDDHGLEVPTLATATVMGDREDRRRLAAEVLAFAASLSS